jgi:hypothetical protein
MCVSLDWIMHVLILAVVVCGVIALLRLLVNFLAPRIGVPADWLAFIAQALWICLWVAVAIFAIIFIFGLIGCLLGWAGGMPSLMPHR